MKTHAFQVYSDNSAVTVIEPYVFSIGTNKKRSKSGLELIIKKYQRISPPKIEPEVWRYFVRIKFSITILNQFPKGPTRFELDVDKEFIMVYRVLPKERKNIFTIPKKVIVSFIEKCKPKILTALDDKNASITIFLSDVNGAIGYELVGIPCLPNTDSVTYEKSKLLSGWMSGKKGFDRLSPQVEESIVSGLFDEISKSFDFEVSGPTQYIYRYF
jgi:hypothetical protein